MHWIAPLIFTTVVGIANYSIYKSSIDYMIAAYGPYAASATGGNDLARDFLAGIAALYSHPCKHTSLPYSGTLTEQIVEQSMRTLVVRIDI